MCGMEKRKLLTGLRKQKRDLRLINWYLAHPKATLQEVGNRFHITKQMVSLILKEYKVNPPLSGHHEPITENSI